MIVHILIIRKPGLAGIQILCICEMKYNKIVLCLSAGQITNGIALVRPPGHHAMTSEFNGFCLCNNVAIAAKNTVDNLGVKRVLIVDFDAHHGQATQRQFYDSSQVCDFLGIHSTHLNISF